MTNKIKKNGGFRHFFLYCTRQRYYNLLKL